MKKLPEQYCENVYCHERNRLTSRCKLFSEYWDDNMSSCDVRKLYLKSIKSNIDDLKKAFEAGRTVSNYKGEWQATYSDDYTDAKYASFDDYIKTVPKATT